MSSNYSLVGNSRSILLKIIVMENIDNPFHVLLAATIFEGGNLLHCISRTNILGE